MSEPSIVNQPAGCRLCGELLEHMMLDLGMSPPCQNRVYEHELNRMEAFYPLRVFLCENCFLVQLEEIVAPESIFDDYAYFSSYSESWVLHAKNYVDMIIGRLNLGANSKVVELASNDGYLLQHFVARSIPCMGVEPAANVAQAAMEKGIPTTVQFFGAQTARNIAAEFGQADLIVGNNVLAHVPDLNDFVKGIKILLAPGGVVTMEFPHLQRLFEENQFDTIYHEHFSYFSFVVAREVFARHKMTLFDVQELKSHGGSIRIFGRHESDKSKPVQPSVPELLQREKDKGYLDKGTYDAFTDKVRATKRDILSFLIEQKNAGKRIVGYGAPGKGNTLLNYCGIREDFLDYTVDISPHKQGTYTPGTHIPVLSPDHLRVTRPDYILILPWNLTDEIVRRNSQVKEWGGKFVVPIPSVRVIN
ncbi:MAG TPA: class I SAM-dependent methyltransferase [Woeseiaceae bacterium]|nr:class I SAM-dependent methyltransferase [Woeseiaceae bacterium]